MANVHVLTIDGNEVSVVMHFAVPSANNAAGVNWRTIAARVFGATTLPDGDGTAGTISAAEKTSVQSGALVEQAQVFKIGTSSPTGAQIDAAFSSAQTAWVADFQNRYARYGTTR